MSTLQFVIEIKIQTKLWVVLVELNSYLITRNKSLTCDRKAEKFILAQKWRDKDG